MDIRYSHGFAGQNSQPIQENDALGRTPWAFVAIGILLLSVVIEIVALLLEPVRDPLAGVRIATVEWDGSNEKVIGKRFCVAKSTCGLEGAVERDEPGVRVADCSCDVDTNDTSGPSIVLDTADAGCSSVVDIVGIGCWRIVDSAAIDCLTVVVCWVVNVVFTDVVSVYSTVNL